MHIAESIS